ncbi:hypothetical protein SEA_RASPUTIA_123 [Microbacterium phage Rasputia]|nr:hypothetical protein SEA_RASPUTIA_123 [Microbacterium phage Rasputia]
MPRKTIVEHGGFEFEAELAVVTKTHLGFEDHGIFSWNIDFKGVAGSWGQGTGHRFATDPFIMHTVVTFITEFFGKYGTWEAITGREVFILRESYSGPIVGLAAKDDADNVFLFSELEDLIEKARENYDKPTGYGEKAAS